MENKQTIEKIGKYKILSVLGKGAMGTVYTAFDPSIERTVALKTIHSELLGSNEKEGVLTRFKREAQSAGQMTHSNIVTIYDFGEDDGVSYIVMEHIKGQTLKETFDNNGKFSNEDIVKLTQILLDALSYAHERGIVHRDIKPDNIILMDNDLQKLKIMDFGIAKIRSSEMTQIGTVMGTPSYMSPEQFLGYPVDHRSDLFSVGVILYQLMTGDKPFSGQISTVMHKVLHEHPPLPSALNVLCPQFIDAVIQKAMAKSPDDRYQNAEEFSSALSNANDIPETEKTVFIESNDPNKLSDSYQLKQTNPPLKRANDKHIDNTSHSTLDSGVQTSTTSPSRLKPIVAIVVLTIGLFFGWRFLSDHQKETSDSTINSSAIDNASPEQKAKTADKYIISPSLDEQSLNNKSNTTPATNGTVFKDIELVWIESGCYQMGDNLGGGSMSERPIHKVCLDGFYIGKYEITQRQWQDVMGDNPAEFKGGDNYPVEKVSWLDTQNYIQKINSISGKKYRLPTEAEWEYACRSGLEDKNYCGSNNIDAVAWYSLNSGGTTHPVGTKESNGFGIYDMCGNVGEWTSDWFDKKSYSSSQTNNPKGPSSGSDRVNRGGSWSNDPWDTRSSNRSWYWPDYSFNYLGFRIVLPAEN